MYRGHHVLSPTALVDVICRHYPIPAPVDLHLYIGVNDTYTVTTPRSRYILRIYQAGWRSVADVYYELDLLTHLERAGISVATLIAGANGARLTVLHAPEGPRSAVLFTYVDGTEPQETEPECTQMGQALATIHARSLLASWTSFADGRQPRADRPASLVQIADAASPQYRAKSSAHAPEHLQG